MVQSKQTLNELQKGKIQTFRKKGININSDNNEY